MEIPFKSFITGRCRPCTCVYKIQAIPKHQMVSVFKIVKALFLKQLRNVYAWTMTPLYSQWGQETTRSELVYCVAVILTMTEQVKQRIRIKFCVKLEHSLTESIRMIQKATTIGNWRLAASSQRAHSCITSRAVFWWNIKSPRRLRPVTAQIWCLWLLAFPQTNITFVREESLGSWWDSGKYHMAADGNWENCVRLQGAYLEGDWGVCHCPLYNVSCIFYLLQ